METIVNKPKFRITWQLFRYPVLVTIAGLLFYILGVNLWLSAFIGLLAIIVLLAFKDQLDLVVFKKKLADLGEPYASDDLYKKSLTRTVGLVPFNKKSISCIVSATKEFVIVGRQETFVKISWSDISFCRSRIYLGNRILEISILKSGLEHQLFIPWVDKLNDCLPNKFRAQCS